MLNSCTLGLRKSDASRNADTDPAAEAGSEGKTFGYVGANESVGCTVSVIVDRFGSERPVCVSVLKMTPLLTRP